VAPSRCAEAAITSRSRFASAESAGALVLQRIAAWHAFRCRAEELENDVSPIDWPQTTTCEMSESVQQREQTAAYWPTEYPPEDPGTP